MQTVRITSIPGTSSSRETSLPSAWNSPAARARSSGEAWSAAASATRVALPIVEREVDQDQRQAALGRHALGGGAAVGQGHAP